MPIEYTLNASMPGERFFRCEPLKATLGVKSCAGMWKQANHGQSERLYQCKRCPVGAEHAGDKSASTSTLKGSMTCSRCHRGAIRLIEKWLCVSCWNRQREAVIGRNAKGQPPTKMRPLAPRCITMATAAGTVQRLSRAMTTCTEELVVAALRDNREAVSFMFTGAAQAQFRQRGLW